MSRQPKPIGLVIEWSPSGVAAYDFATRKTTRASSLEELAPSLSSTEALFAVARRACFVRTVPVPDAPRDAVKQALALSIGQHVPVVAGEACFDLLLTRDRGPQGQTATLAAMRAQDLRLLHEQAKQAGLRVTGVVPVAFGSLLLAQNQGLANCAVVSEGAEGLGVDLVERDELRYSRSLPPGLSAPALDSELGRTFGAAGLPCSPTLAAGLGLEEADYRTQRTPLEALVEGSSRLGIALELPEDVLARTKAAKSRRARLAGLLCLSAALLATLVYFDRVDAQAAVDQKRAAMASSLRKMRSTQTSVQNQLTEATALQATLDRAFKPSQRMGDIIMAASNAVPPQMWLTGASVERGGSLLIRGTALSSEQVATYLEALSREPRLRDVKLLFANNGRIEQTPVVQFSISAFPVGNLPLVEKRTGRSR